MNNEEEKKNLINLHYSYENVEKGKNGIYTKARKITLNRIDC